MMIVRMIFFLAVELILPLHLTAQAVNGVELPHSYSKPQIGQDPPGALFNPDFTAAHPADLSTVKNNPAGISADTLLSINSFQQSSKPGPSDLITPVMFRFSDSSPGGPGEWIRQKPGAAWLSSAILPGSAQAIQGNWLRAALYFTVESAALYTHFDYLNKGRAGERDYRKYADENWSVVQYANWIIRYHDKNDLSNPHLGPLRESMEGVTPSFNIASDWNRVNRELLNRVERETPYITPDNLSAGNFSHRLDRYGSQQYYELISKYYQYSGGWRDYYEFHTLQGTDPFKIDRNGQYASPYFHTGAKQSKQFNDDFRRSNTWLSLLILNHFVSALDAFFTVNLRNHNLEVSTGENPLHFFHLVVRF
ncbi:MAG: hypothetical protein WD035_03610 [Balneolaceae bacterium]